MKAAVNEVYGMPDVLEVKQIDKPTPKKDEVLIEVYASSVNRTDDGFLRAKPFVTRFFSGLTKPRHKVLGCEFAGKIVELGDNVSLFKVGDKVFGFDDVTWGGHGEFKTIKQTKSVTTMPEGKTYAEMAACGEGAHYALCYLRAFKVHEGKKVFVHGATGAIGSAAVQLLKQAGAYVVATSTTKNVDLVKSLGADKVIDWEKQDFTDQDELFDVVFDAVGKSSFGACKRLLKPRGIYVATELGPKSQNPLLGIVSPLYKLVGARRVMFPLPRNTKEIIEFIRDAVANGELTPVIDKTYALSEIAEAYRYVETGEKTGNVVIKIK